MINLRNPFFDLSSILNTAETSFPSFAILFAILRMLNLMLNSSFSNKLMVVEHKMSGLIAKINDSQYDSP